MCKKRAYNGQKMIDREEVCEGLHDYELSLNKTFY